MADPTSSTPWYKRKITPASTFKLVRTALTITAFSYFTYTLFITAIKKKLSLKVSENTILRYNYDQLTVTEAPLTPTLISFPAFLQSPSTKITFLDLIEALAMAEKDSRVKGLIIDFGATAKEPNAAPLGLAQLHELREKIEQLKETKKRQFGEEAKFVAYTDDFEDQKRYYLASAFDTIIVSPLAQIPLYGLGTRSLFFKNALDKLGVDFNASMREQHKGVYSPLTGTGYTDAIKSNLGGVFASLNRVIMEGILVSRSSSLNLAEIKNLKEKSVKGKREDDKDALSMLQDLAPLSAKESFSVGLIDGIAFTRDKFLASLVSVEHMIATTPRIGDLMSKTDAFFKSDRTQVKDLHKYLMGERLVRKATKINWTSLFGIIDVSEPIVIPEASVIALEDAFIVIEPTIVPAIVKPNLTLGIITLSGSMSRGIAQFGSEALSQAFIDASEDSSIDALLFRIDTGGGDARAAENLWQTIMDVRKRTGIPVIASFGNVCASGGYYVAAACDEIVCGATTITGSIGVASARPVVLDKLLKVLGVTVDEIGESEGFKNTTMFGYQDDASKTRSEARLDETYELFLSKVCDGRGLSMNDVRAIAGGRIFSGVDALKAGLVDRIGGYEDALKVCAGHGMKGKVFASEKIILKTFPKHLGVFESIDRMGGSLSYKTLLYEVLQTVNQPVNRDTIEMDSGIVSE